MEMIKEIGDVEGIRSYSRKSKIDPILKPGLNLLPAGLLTHSQRDFQRQLKKRPGSFGPQDQKIALPN